MSRIAYSAKVSLLHCFVASILKRRNSRREMKWSWWLKVLSTAECIDRKRRADPGDLKPCIFRSRHRTT